MSRTTLALLFAASPAMAVAADPVTAEQVIDSHRQLFKTPDELDCPRGEGDEIVVCGRRNERSPYRLAVPPGRTPGKPIPGEPLTGGFNCVSRCEQPLSVDILGTAVKVAKGLKRVLESDR